MIQAPEISIVAYGNGLKKVSLRSEANHVTLRIKKGNMIEYLILPKKTYNTYRKRITQSWDLLPEVI